MVRPGRGFRGLALVTVLSVFTLVTLGGVVRLTGSGLGCPDWPLCHGKVIPPLDGHTLIEYSHRLMASVVGALVLATAFVVWRSYRRAPWLLVPASLGLLLLVVQVLLGGVTVLKELPPAIVLAHLAVAEALMVCMVVVCMEALRGPGPVRAPADLSWRRGAFPFLALAALLGAYVILLTGSYVATSGWATACGQSWPLCQGQLIPDGYGATMHMVHRVLALVVGVLIVTVLAMAWRRRFRRRDLGWVAVVVGVTLLAQVGMGGAIVGLGFSMASRLVHLALGTLVWVGLAVLAILVHRVPRFELRGVARA